MNSPQLQLQSSREAARRLSCSNKMRQLSLGSLNYESARGYFPVGYHDGPAVVGKTKPSFNPSFGKTPYMSLLTQLLPYLEQEPLWEQSQVAYQQEWFPFGSEVHQGSRQMISGFLCPSSENGWDNFIHSDWGEVAFTTYLGVNGTDYRAKNGMYCISTKRRAAEVLDGLSNTICFGERPPSNDLSFGWWYAGLGINGTLLGTDELNGRLHGNVICVDGPHGYKFGTRSQCDSLHFWSNHPGGCNFAMGDGSVQFIGFDVSQGLFNGLTRFVQWTWND